MTWQALSKIEHRDSLIVSRRNFSFLKGYPVFPVCLFELAACVPHLPIVFAKFGKNIKPVMLMGLKSDENLLISPTGGWGISYIPAMVDVYPFRLNKTDTGKRVLAFLDEAGFVISHGEGNRIFDEDGNESDVLKKYIELLNRIDHNETVSSRACEAIAELSLFEEARIQIPELPGKEKGGRLGGFLAVKPSAFENLDEEKFIELRKSHALNLIYAHFFSIQNLNKLYILRNLKSQTSSNLEELGAQIFTEQAEEIDFGI